MLPLIDLLPIDLPWIDMPSIYLYFAVFGGSFMFIQLLLAMFGFGFGGTDTDFSGGTGDDVDAPAVGSSYMADLFRVISLRTLIAFFTFFGLGGMAGLQSGLVEPLVFFVALAFGTAALFSVYYMYQKLYSLRFDGTVSEKTLVGATGTVYTKIPPGGRGKVLVSQQGRTMEYEAITTGETTLASGTPIVVVKLITAHCVEVKTI